MRRSAELELGQGCVRLCVTLYRCSSRLSLSSSSWPEADDDGDSPYWFIGSTSMHGEGKLGPFMEEGELGLFLLMLDNGERLAQSWARRAACRGVGSSAL
ncbi:hypothetical protein Dimus_000944 [Dionaea muscipula]